MKKYGSLIKCIFRSDMIYNYLRLPPSKHGKYNHKEGIGSYLRLLY